MMMQRTPFRSKRCRKKLHSSPNSAGTNHVSRLEERRRCGEV